MVIRINTGLVRWC